MTSDDTTTTATTTPEAPVEPTPAPVAPAAKRRHSTGVVLGAGLVGGLFGALFTAGASVCLLYTSPSPRDGLLARMPSSA